jgi:RNA polymerase sigma factor (sigma-70 family)
MSVTQSDRPAVDAAWEDAFAEICDRHRGRLIRWLTSIFGARDAEDIAQEALVRLFLRPGLLDPAGDPWPWLSVVARNVGRDMVKHNALSSAVDHLTLADLPDERHVWDEVLARDDAERLVRALRALRPRDRALIRLRDVQDLPMAEVAALLGVTENAARQQLFRARRRLAESFTKLGGDRLGLFPSLGLRVREAFRRNANVLESLGLTSPAIAAVLPCLVCAVAIAGGALFPGATPASATAAGHRPPGAEREVGHGTGGRAPALGYAAAAPPRRVAERDAPPAHRPVIDEHRDLGPAGFDAMVTSVTAARAGRPDGVSVWVDLPVWGRFRIDEDSWQTGDHGVVCDVGVYCN